MVVIMSDTIATNETISNAVNGPSNEEPVTEAETRRFALFSEDSIKCIGDQNGLDSITDDAIRLLSSDVSYRLRHLVHNSIEFMRQSKRRRLTATDINRALEASDCEKVLGFETNDHQIDETFVSGANVFVVEDPVIDLRDEVNKVIDGSDCDLNLFANDLVVNWHVVGEKRYLSDDDFTNECSEPQKTYYEVFVKVVLGSDSNLFLTAIKDLSTNRRLIKLVPYLINFIRTGIRRFAHDIPQLKRLLQIIPCLLRNPSLHLSSEPNQTVLVQSILECITEPLNPMSDHWNLRDLASHLLTNVLNHWLTPLEGQRNLEKTFVYLRNCLLDFTKPFSSHYGVIKTFQSFGYDAILNHLYPILDQYLVHLLSVIDDPNPSPSNSCHRSDAIKVFGELLLTMEVLALKTRSLICNDMEPKLNHKDYNLLSDIFGDSLYARLPAGFAKIRPKYYAERSKNRSERPKSLFETSDSHKTGEELLDQFYEQPTHIEDRKSEMSALLEDDNSFEENSVVSDNDRETTNSTDVLQVKSTISDPKLGIKLTIKKLKTEHNGPSDRQQADQRSRVNRLNSSQISDPVFETISLQNNSIIFDYGQNKETVCQRLLRSGAVFEPSKWFAISMLSPNRYPMARRAKIKRNVKHLSLYSCDLFNVI